MPKATPAYLKELLEKLAAGEKLEPGHYNFIVEHESWCPFLRCKGPCVCKTLIREATDIERVRMGFMDHPMCEDHKL